MVFSCQSDASDETQIDLEDQTRNPSLVAGCAVDGNDIDLNSSGSGASRFFNQNRQNEYWAFFTELILASARTIMIQL